MTIRFAVWAAVSTEQQAGPEKVSIAEQVARSRNAAQAHGWTEASGPFIAPGASRSFYVNLSDAEREIPSLRSMLEAARSRSFDLLIVYSYDRLGDLTDMVAQTLRFYGVQLYSVSQPTEPQIPDQFDPYSSDSEGIMRDVARITQRFRINDLRRKWKIGIPDRIRRGLPASRPSYGYTWTGKRTPPVLDPETSAVVLRIKDKFLSGQSLLSISHVLTAESIPSPRGKATWDRSTIRRILENPFYAGQVIFGRTKWTRDARDRQKTHLTKLPAARWQVGTGKHEPLWDEATHLQIIDELSRRYEIHKRAARRFPLSGLLTCSVCGQKLHRRMDGWVRHDYVFACATGPAHVIIPYNDGIEQVSEHLAASIRQRDDLQLAPPVAAAPDPSRKIEQLKARRRKIQEGYEKDLYTAAEASDRMSALEREAEALQQTVLNREQAALAWENWRAGADLTRLAEWIRTDDPALVNRLLTSIIETVVVSPDRSMRVVWRE
jgi:DNA invertase Pin-like site-specific DNA recombinase